MNQRLTTLTSKSLALCLLAMLCSALSLAGRQATGTIAINTQERLQTIEGWGVSLCWWANMCGRWDDERIDEIVDWLVSPNGLNYNIFRYNIGGGDDPQWRHCRPHHMAHGKGIRAEMEGFLAEPGAAYQWERDAAQRKILLKIKERRPDAIFEAFSNSPPYWMTYSGCVGGNTPATADNLKPEYYEAFARYLVDVCCHYRDAYGVEFRTLEPFNEPVTDYWHASGSQEGCHFSPEAQMDFIRILKRVLDESGLKTVIAASDETSIEQSASDFRAYQDDGLALEAIGQWNTHSYHATDKAREELRQLAAKAGKRLWMSEVGEGGRGIHGNLTLAQKLIDDMRIMQPVAWVDWQYVEEVGDQWCLVNGNFATQQYRRVHNYYIRQHFSRFMPAGSTIVCTDDRHTLAALSPDGSTLTATIINNTRESLTRTICVTGFAPSLHVAEAYRTSRTEELARLESPLPPYRLVLPPQSITTIIFKKGSNLQSVSI